uniref:Uncharacterized protein n=1 Tax=Schizaphis graminum TaxID=13262 RepID=A0A2S2PAZ6_SCHGA
MQSSSSVAVAAMEEEGVYGRHHRPPSFLFRSVRRRSCSVAVAVAAAAAAPSLPQLGPRRSRQTQFRHGGSRTFRDHTHTPRHFYLLHTEHTTLTTTITITSTTSITTRTQTLIDTPHTPSRVPYCFLRLLSFSRVLHRLIRKKNNNFDIDRSSIGDSVFIFSLWPSRVCIPTL